MPSLLVIVVGDTKGHAPLLVLSVSSMGYYFVLMYPLGVRIVMYECHVPLLVIIVGEMKGRASLLLLLMSLVSRYYVVLYLEHDEEARPGFLGPSCVKAYRVIINRDSMFAAF